jgi:hypothetical protein
MDRVLPRRAILQYLVDDILPAEDIFLQKLTEIAGAGTPAAPRNLTLRPKSESAR